MLFYWGRRALAWVLLLFVPPKIEAPVPMVRSNLPCPVCGWVKCRLRCVQKEIDRSGADTAETLLQRTCDRCGARVYEKPVLKVTPKLVHPAIARTAIEEREDSEAFFAMAGKEK